MDDCGCPETLRCSLHEADAEAVILLLGDVSACDLVLAVVPRCAVMRLPIGRENDEVASLLSRNVDEDRAALNH